MSLLKRKKVSPEELKTKLMIAEKKLEKREEELKKKRNNARDSAKEALRKGDERAFRISSRRYGMLQGQLHAISNMVEITATMRDMVEMQEGLNDILEVGNELKNYQEKLGIDSKKLEEMVTNIRVSSEKLSAASEIISNTIDAIAAGSLEATEAQEELRKELMAEIAAESKEEEEIEKKIKEEEG